MGKLRGLGLNLIFVCVFLVATTCTCLGVANATVVCSEQERLALLKFKHSVKDDFGMLSSWVGNDSCMWEGIYCDNVTGTVEGLHLKGGRGSGFDDDRYCLVGNEVSSSLAQHRHLKYLDLSGNDFQGSMIPEFIGSFKQLRYLNLSNAIFSGIVPHYIGNLSNLKVLDLSSNSRLISDDMAWTFGLSSLEHLDLSSVDLSGAQNWDMVLYMIPSLEELSLQSCGLPNADLGPILNSSRVIPNIKHLDLGLNLVKGPLPHLFQNMTSLTFLDISGFDLSLAWNFADLLNTVPSLSELHLSGCGLDQSRLSTPHLNFSTLSNIQHLDLSENSIEGVFPFVLTNMSSLKVLDLSMNQLNSSVPIMPNLLELDLSFNQFKQIEHIGISKQCHLKKLSASNNFFERVTIDSTKNVSECSEYALEMLDLSWSLNDTFPEPIGRMKNIRSLHLVSNNSTGSVPESLTRLSFLEVLDLSNNHLTGPIPTFLGKQISKLDLSFNQLEGSIPESFGNLASLTNLNLGVNRLTGPIPTSLGRLVSLQALSVYSNLLNGTIPLSIGQLVNLHSLEVSDNSLEGVVSEAHFANLSLLKRLDASSNTKLTFNVSREWMPTFKLETLLLGSCNIVNGFPQWLRNQKKLQTLVLSNATISGPLPTWLRNMPIIPYLDLSHNKLSGPLTNLPNVGNVDVFGYGVTGALLLENNLFNESIPMSLCKREDLQFLDLSVNMLTGKIPKCVGSLQKLATMIFSSNQLSGIIPSSIALASSSLDWLKLNDKNFVGEIPRELGNLQALRVLDLGNNELSGNIPEWIGEKLASLMVLRLHKNNFTGRIPPSLCKTPNLQILDIAYNNFTGTIPRCLGKLTAMVNSSSEVPSYGNPLDPDENVIQVMKGVDLEYTKTWEIVFNMDLSSNKLVGEIPVELTALSMLVGLNLSNNHLSGSIPNNIGNMTKLFSLDLSGNELTGIIPPSMAALNFLSHLNLSHNNLSGRIPSGHQLQTLTDPSIYADNKDLCGPPLPRNCSNHEVITTTEHKKKSDEAAIKLWFALDIMSGFATGFWGVIGVLLLKKNWRRKLFVFAEETIEKIHVAVLIRIAKKKREKEAA